jgi:hypothetical protein
VAFYSAERDHKLSVLRELQNLYDWKNDQLMFYPKVGMLKERDEGLSQHEEDVSHEESIQLPW